MRVLVTGATGFVGRRLCGALASRGHQVTGAVRRPAESDLPAGVLPVQVGDMGPGTPWDEALSGIEGIVHLAARAHVMRDTAADPEAEYRRVNVEATRCLAERAMAAGVRRFVFMSTVKVNGERTEDRPFQPADPPAPEDAYGRTKRDAEAAVWTTLGDSATEAVVVRSPLVYGPGVKGNFLTLLKAVHGGMLLPFGAIDNRRSMVFVDNLADALIAALEQPAAAGETFYVRDDEDVSTTELIRRMAGALERPARLLPVPAALLRLAGRLTGKHDMARRITGSLQVDDSATRKTLRWSPPHTMKEGLEQTAAWYKSRNGE